MIAVECLNAQIAQHSDGRSNHTLDYSTLTQGVRTPPLKTKIGTERSAYGAIVPAEVPEINQGDAYFADLKGKGNGAVGEASFGEGGFLTRVFSGG